MSLPIHEAILASQAELFGCPACGFRSSNGFLSGPGFAFRNCADPDCRKHFVVVGDRSPIDEINRRFLDRQYRIIGHPRTGTPSHGVGDACPVGGGDFFASRGVGTDSVPCCVFCIQETGTWTRQDSGRRHNIAAFVRCKESGERILADIFCGAGWIDFRENYPDRVQLKIGACKRCLPRLEALSKSCDSVITREKFQAAMDVSMLPDEVPHVALA